MDALAAEEILLAGHYSGSTLCAPSRSVLMTGEEQQREHPVLYGAFSEQGPKQAVRAGKWKLIRAEYRGRWAP